MTKHLVADLCNKFILIRNTLLNNDGIYYKKIMQQHNKHMQPPYYDDAAYNLLRGDTTHCNIVDIAYDLLQGWTNTTWWCCITLQGDTTHCNTTILHRTTGWCNPLQHGDALSSYNVMEFPATWKFCILLQNDATPCNMAIVHLATSRCNPLHPWYKVMQPTEKLFYCILI